MRPPGLPGQLVGELTVKGVIKTAKAGFVAMLQASDNKTYIGRPGDRVMDGSIKSIAQDAVVFSQDVNDPLSLVKQREVRKTIRPEDDNEDDSVERAASTTRGGWWPPARSPRPPAALVLTAASGAGAPRGRLGPDERPNGGAAHRSDRARSPTRSAGPIR